MDCKQGSLGPLYQAVCREIDQGVVSAIAPDPRTVVVFGANFFGRACRTGDVAGPVVVKGIRRALAKERVVILADEFNSTKCHAVCGSVMRPHPDDPHEKWCDTCGCAVDRDGNAATNIHSVWPRYLLDGQRPEHLRRVPHGRLQAKPFRGRVVACNNSFYPLHPMPL